MTIPDDITPNDSLETLAAAYDLEYWQVVAGLNIESVSPETTISELEITLDEISEILGEFE